MKALNLSRRRFFGGVSVAAASMFGYAHFVEAERLQTTRHDVPISHGQRAPLKLLHISDLHASPVVSLSYIANAIERGLALGPDVICITGDFVTDQYKNATEYAHVLHQLADAAPCFAVFGNHDGGEWSGQKGGYGDLVWATDLLREANLPLLRNRSANLRIKDWNLTFVGVGDAWAGDVHPAEAFQGVNGDNVILLSHNPDTKTRLAAYPWDLMLSGHTHGGQLCLPFIGAPLAPVQDKRYIAGLYRWKQRWLHITRGVGSIWGMRINCPPEVSLLTLC